jgi:hypothetical protein
MTRTKAGAYEGIHPRSPGDIDFVARQTGALPNGMFTPGRSIMSMQPLHIPLL